MLLGNSVLIPLRLIEASSFFFFGCLFCLDCVSVATSNTLIAGVNLVNSRSGRRGNAFLRGKDQACRAAHDRIS